jgi:hypothetical protein
MWIHQTEWLRPAHGTSSQRCIIRWIDTDARWSKFMAIHNHLIGITNFSFTIYLFPPQWWSLNKRVMLTEHPHMRTSFGGHPDFTPMDGAAQVSGHHLMCSSTISGPSIPVTRASDVGHAEQCATNSWPSPEYLLAQSASPLSRCSSLTSERNHTRTSSTIINPPAQAKTARHIT